MQRGDHQRCQPLLHLGQPRHHAIELLHRAFIVTHAVTLPILRLRPCASANPGDDTSTANMAPITIRRTYIVMLLTTVSWV